MLSAADGAAPVLTAPDAPPLVLASGSSSRAAILAATGMPFRQQAAAVDEDEIKASFKAAGGSAGDAAVALAELKAGRVASQSPPDCIVLGADQILTEGEDWFDKPADLEEAGRQLLRLSGREHELHSALVAIRGGARVWHHLARSRLWMRPLSAAFVDHYLEVLGAQALTSVGSYHIEGLGAQLFSRIEGDPFAIRGLPLLPLLAFLRDQGVLMR
jgi:septum formation protein